MSPRPTDSQPSLFTGLFEETQRRALSESAVVESLAQEASLRITRKTISFLHQLKVTLSGGDSGLKTTWDEICAQVQYEESHFWDAYDETVRDIVRGFITELPIHEQEAIWLQTKAGINWGIEEPEDRDVYPICDDDIVEYLTREFVYAEAGRWSNSRIRAFIEQARVRD
jgi:hypothetical protein